MSVRRTVSRYVLAVVGVMSVAQAADPSASAGAESAREWLKRMSHALATRNYDARFLHLAGGHAENLRIVHRVADGAVTERLVSLDGGREVVRTQSEVICYLPDRRTVLVEKRTDNRSLLSTIPAYSEELQSYYDLSVHGEGRILGRAARLIRVQPRDAYRYGYRLWLDAETALPLKAQLCDRQGRVLEQMVLTDLQTPETIDPAWVRASVDTTGFRWMRQTAGQRVEVANAARPWTVANAPQGFRLQVVRVQKLGGQRQPVDHLVLSDGLASVSVFIERRVADGETAGDKQDGLGAKDATPEMARVGTAMAYALEADGYRVTVVGEVPSVTLQAIAHSVRAAQPDRKPEAQ